MDTIRLPSMEKGGSGVWVPLKEIGKVFAVEIATGDDAEQCLFAANHVKETTLEDLVKGLDQTDKVADSAKPDQKKPSDFELAELHHIRLGHPRGLRLYKEIGVRRLVTSAKSARLWAWRSGGCQR